MKSTRISDCIIIKDLNLNILENSQLVSLMDIERLFYLYDISLNSVRGEHAHINCKQFVIPLNGCFKIKIYDGLNEKVLNMSDSSIGLYIPSGIWVELYDFSPGSICFVLASENYDESDYIRNIDNFENFKNDQSN